MNGESERKHRLISLFYVIVQFGVILTLLSVSWGSVSEVLSHPARAGMIVAMALGSLTILATGVSISRDAATLRAELLALIPLGLIAAFYFWVIPMTDRFAWFVFYPGEEVRYTGMLVFMTGTGLRTWGFLARKERLNLNGLTPEIDTANLVVSGIYQRMRYPQYLGLWLQALGFALVFRSWLGFAVSVTLVWPLVNRMDAEDRYLLALHGERFSAWSTKSWRMFPGLY